MMRDLSFAGHAKATLALGLPLVGSHLAQMGLHVADMVMMGWYGIVPLAAVVLGAASFFVVFIMGAGFAQAVMPMVASALAAGDEAQVRRDTRMGLWLSMGFGLAVYPLFWWSGTLLAILGQKPEVAALAQDFLRVAGLGMVPALMVMALKSYLAALQRTQVVLWVTVGAVLVNVALNWVFIFGNLGAPELGVSGAALSSLLVQAATFAALGLYAGWLPELRRFRLWHNFTRPDLSALKGVFRLGWPIGITGLAESGMFHGSALMMGWIGTRELAAHGIAMEVVSLSFMVHLGLSNAVTVRTAQALGEGDMLALRRGAWAGIALSLGFGSAMVALFLAAPQAVIGLFLDQAKLGAAEIIAYATLLLAMAALFQLADAMQVIALGLLRGVKDTRVPMMLAALGYWVIGIPSGYGLAFGLGWGGVGLWSGPVLGLTFVATLLMWRFWHRLPQPGRV